MPQVDVGSIARLLAAARGEGRAGLFEHECYELFELAGIAATPVRRFVPRGARATAADLAALAPGRVVVKIVSPDIVHKTEARGVRVVAGELEAVNGAVERMLDESPAAWAGHLAAHPGALPPELAGLSPVALRARLAERVRGVLLVRFVEADASGLASELFVGLRASREFGPVLSAGVGGVTMEALAARSQPGAAVVLAPAALVDGARFLELFRATLAYERLSGRLRGSTRLVDDAALAATFQTFIDLADRFSAASPAAELHLSELEVNPFVVAGGRLVPLDGVCSFAPAAPLPVPRPRAKIEKLLRPRSAAVIGVSEKSLNMGRIILRNLFAAGFDPGRAFVVRPGVESIDGARSVPTIAALPEKVDLFVVAVGAAQVPEVVGELIDHDRANAVILIPGGLGEKEGSRELERALKQRIAAAHLAGDGGPVFVGGNSMGIVSHPGRYDTWFIPDDKLPKSRGERRRRLAFLSQSGAFIIANLSQLTGLDPLYALSIGNQIDLSAGDLLTFLKDEPEVEVLAVYMEGFNDGDGLALARAVREATAAGKDVVFYKAGRTQEGRSATAGHTASVAGDYAVCEAALREAGALVARDFEEFGDFARLALAWRGKRVAGRRLAAMSNAGFEAVGMADAIRVGSAQLALAGLSERTCERLQATLRQHRLDGLVDAKNPLDVTPMAADAAFAELFAGLLDDEGVDLVVTAVVPLTPALETLPGAPGGPSIDRPESVARRLPELARGSRKPVVAVVASGALFDPLVARLEAGGLPVFRAADRAVRALTRFVDARLGRN